MNTLGEKLNELRKEKGFTLTELSQKSGVSEATLINWLKGKTKPNRVKLKKIADALEHDYYELFNLL